MFTNYKLQIPACAGKTNYKKGFTLLELLIVMAIIGILGGLFVSSYPAGQKRARDTQRKNDIRQYQTALENFATRNNGYYPFVNTGRSASDVQSPSLCNYLGLNISSGVDCPADPRDNQSVCSSGICRYYFVSNGSGFVGSASSTQYVIWARLEQPTVSGSPVYVVCSTGKTGETATTPSNYSCPI